jgi:glycosyltransferase involved in cell wall biosynthesis/MoaA/NifB/PqqE/SkfB family radical SAM enzyme
MTSSSILIPAYNCAAALPACLDSILEQTAQPLEIIVIDDGSTDETAKVAEKFDGIRLIRRTERGGAGAARASGVREARGDIVVFIDSDCIAPIDWLEKITACFDENPEYGAVGGMYRHCHAKSLISIFGKFEEEYLHHNFALTPHQSTLTGGNMAVRRSVWNEARSGRELIHFQQVASSEDTVVANEIRAVSTTYFTTDIYVSHLPKDDFRGFFRRNILRARTRMISNLLGLSKGGDNLFAAFGGFRLFWAAAAIWAILPVLVAMIIFPEGRGPGVTVIAASLAMHYILALPFFRFINSNSERPCPVKVGPIRIIALRLLVAGRAACWVIGTLFGVGQYFRERTRYYTKIILSILHFWWPGRISKLFYFVTSKCNARCEFCFNLDNVINWKQRQPQELTLDEIQKLAANLNRLPYVTFSGGEPFARKDLPKVVRAFYDNAQTMWVTIPTNGALTKKIAGDVFDILTTCPDLFLTIQFSIDSLHEAHDESRKIKGGFEAMLKTADQLSSLRRHYKNLRVQINTPYDTFNLQDIDTIRDFCKANIDFDQQLFYMFREDGTLISDQNAHLADSFLTFIQDHDVNEWRERGRNLWGLAVRALQGVTYEDTRRIKLNKEYIRPCHATQHFVTLYDDGTITPCEVLSATDLGNIRDFDYDYYKMKIKNNLNRYHKKQIVDIKCNCEWMCAPTMNMLYHVPTWYRIAKGLFRPNQSNQNRPLGNTAAIVKESD